MGDTDIKIDILSFNEGTTLFVVVDNWCFNLEKYNIEMVWQYNKALSDDMIAYIIVGDLVYHWLDDDPCIIFRNIVVDNDKIKFDFGTGMLNGDSCNYIHGNQVEVNVSEGTWNTSFTMKTTITSKGEPYTDIMRKAVFDSAKLIRGVVTDD